MLKSLSFALIALSSTTALAAGPDNIFGVAGRLESLTCRGAYVFTRADAEKSLAAAFDRACGDLERNNAPAADEQKCMLAQIRALGRPAPGAVFTGVAIEGQKSLRMQIVDNGSVAFSSLRQGLHGDNADGSISLLFERVGVSGDSYMISGGLMNDNMTKMDMLDVPVRRRVLADLEYFFTEGCTMSWSNQSE